MGQWLESLREAWEKLSERERTMLSGLGAGALVMIVLLAMWTSSAANAEVEDERDEIRQVLQDIARASDVLEQRDRERAAIEARFRNTPPPLAAFLENKAKDEGLVASQVVEQPEKDVSGYRRQHVRLQFNSVSLRPIMRFLASIEAENMPLAIERVEIQHYQTGDVYKVQIGVLGFEKKAGSGKADASSKKGSDK